MANNGFAMDMEAVATSGSNVSNSSEGVGTSISSFTSHVGAVDSAWTGDDAQAFQAAAEQLNKDLQEAQEFLNHVGSHLSATSNAVGETVASNVSNINKVMDNKTE